LALGAAFDIEDLAARLDATERSVYRWLAALHDADWIVYEHAQGTAGLHRRVRIR
jgi:MarR-like DNA-binding transcriptional regulator SgrR of sgrS sRNA